MQPRNTSTATPPETAFKRRELLDGKTQPATIVRAKGTYQALVVPHERRSTFAETLAERA
jgi:hypothetical protein